MNELLVELKKLTSAVQSNAVPRLWSAKDIAIYMGLATSTVEKKVVTHHDFPVAILPSGDRIKRYKPQEVMEWAERRRAQLPKPRSTT